MRDLRCTCAQAGGSDGKSENKFGSKPKGTFDNKASDNAKKQAGANNAELCKRCGKAIAEKGGGSITQFVFGDSRCQCQTPLRAKKVKLDERKFATLTSRWTKSTDGDGSPKSEPAKRHQFAPGTIIGGVYIIERLLGLGGMGMVYRVRHKTLGRICALKVLDGNLINQKNWKRFQIEAKSISGLSHPCFVHVYDLALHEENQPYYVMDYLDGVTLDEIIREGPLDAKQATELFLTVADGLAFAHRHGVIHRDLKPANIFIEERADGTHTTKILDFGIAKLVGMDSEEQSLTSMGDVFGSPYYMSPEQCLGEPVDARSDIYSLGCSLFEAVAGRPPFDSQLPLDIVEAHIAEPCPHLSECTDAALPAGLSALVEKCLQKDPSDRYQNVDKLISDLRLVLKGEGARLEDTYQAGQRAASRTASANQQRRESFEDQTNAGKGAGFKLTTALLTVTGILAVALASWAMFALLHPNGKDILTKKDTFHNPELLKEAESLVEEKINANGPANSADEDMVAAAIPPEDSNVNKSKNARSIELVQLDNNQFYKTHFGNEADCTLLFSDALGRHTIKTTGDQLLPVDPDNASLYVNPKDTALLQVLRALPDNYLTDIKLADLINDDIDRELERQRNLHTWTFAGKVTARHFATLEKSMALDALNFTRDCSVDSNELLKFLSREQLIRLRSFQCDTPVSNLQAILDTLRKKPRLTGLYLSQPAYTALELATIAKMSTLGELALYSKQPFLTDSEFENFSALKNLCSMMLIPVLLTEKSSATFLAMKKLGNAGVNLAHKDWPAQAKEKLVKAMHLPPGRFSVNVVRQ